MSVCEITDCWGVTRLAFLDCVDAIEADLHVLAAIAKHGDCVTVLDADDLAAEVGEGN